MTQSFRWLGSNDQIELACKNNAIDALSTFSTVILSCPEAWKAANPVSSYNQISDTQSVLSQSFPLFRPTQPQSLQTITTFPACIAPGFANNSGLPAWVYQVLLN